MSQNAAVVPGTSFEEAERETDASGRGGGALGGANPGGPGSTKTWRHPASGNGGNNPKAVWARLLWIALFAVSAGAATSAPDPARRVVLVVWDGMRRDFINPQSTPNLAALAEKGVFFASHHPAYPSSTEVNGAAIATGVHPRVNGIIANAEYRPALRLLEPVATEDVTIIRRGDKLTQGRYLGRPTVAEILRQKGLKTAVAGSKPVAILLDRMEREDASSPVFHGTGVMPKSILAPLLKSLGEPPDYPSLLGQANGLRDKWATDALLSSFWEKEIPAYSVLWLSEPDYSQHVYGPGAPTALDAIQHCDQMLGLVVKEIARRGLTAQTDVLVVSDHGFSTIYRSSDYQQLLTGAGLKASRRFLLPPAKGDVMVVGTGGAALIYVTGHDPEVIRTAVTLIQSKDTAGVIFTKDALPGTFQLSDAMVDSPDAPDILVSMRWKAGRGPSGAEGLIIAEGAAKAGGGNHVTLGPTDMRNTLVAAGPDFLQGRISETPSGNVDLAPTILHILGVRPPAPMDGRVLTEALKVGGGPAPMVVTNRLEVTATLPTGKWTQYLERVKVGETVYLNEGNGKWESEGTLGK